MYHQNDAVKRKKFIKTIIYHFFFHFSIKFTPISDFFDNFFPYFNFSFFFHHLKKEKKNWYHWGIYHALEKIVYLHNSQVCYVLNQETCVRFQHFFRQRDIFSSSSFLIMNDLIIFFFSLPHCICTHNTQLNFLLLSLI